MKKFIKLLKTIDKDTVKKSALGHYLKDIELSLRGDLKRADNIVGLPLYKPENRNLYKAYSTMKGIMCLSDLDYNYGFLVRDQILDYVFENGIMEELFRDLLKDEIHEFISKNRNNVTGPFRVYYVKNSLIIEYNPIAFYAFFTDKNDVKLSVEIKIKENPPKTFNEVRARLKSWKYSKDLLESETKLSDELTKIIKEAEISSNQNKDLEEKNTVNKMLAVYRIDMQKVNNFSNKENKDKYINGLKAIISELNFRMN